MDLFRVFVKKMMWVGQRIVRRWMGLDWILLLIDAVLGKRGQPRTYFILSNGHVQRISGHCMTCGLCEVLDFDK